MHPFWSTSAVRSSAAATKAHRRGVKPIRDARLTDEAPLRSLLKYSRVLGSSSAGHTQNTTALGQASAAQDSWHPELKRHKPKQQKDPAQRNRIARPVRQQVLQRQHWPTQQHPAQLQPDPAADDLDLLATAAAAATHVTPVLATSASPSGAQTHATVSPGTEIYSIPDAKPQYALPADRAPRFTAMDKLQLSRQQLRDIGRRLRRPLQGAGPILRVFRYSLDDLRLYKAVDLAGLEGRVVVVDTPTEADAVLTTYSKRTRRNVNLAIARRIAAGAGVPLVVLPAVSAQRLVEAVGPWLQLPTVQGDAQEGRAAGGRQLHLTNQPRQLRWEEVEADGSDELLQLLWMTHHHHHHHSSSSSHTSALDSAQLTAVPSAVSVSGACCQTPRWLAWCAAQEASPQAAELVFATVRSADVEDARSSLVPANPTARAGERHLLLKPWRPRSRIKRRQLQRDLALRRADW